MIPVPAPNRERGIGPGAQALYVGLWTGGLLVLVMIGSLLIATRVPQLEPYAYLRNLTCYAAAILAMLLPLFLFYHAPSRLFISGLLGWAILSFCYLIAGMYFRNLESRIDKTTFEFLVLGIIVYGTVAVASWVVNCIVLHACHARQVRQAKLP